MNAPELEDPGIFMCFCINHSPTSTLQIAHILPWAWTLCGTLVTASFNNHPENERMSPENERTPKHPQKLPGFYVFLRRMKAKQTAPAPVCYDSCVFFVSSAWAKSRALLPSCGILSNQCLGVNEKCPENGVGVFIGCMSWPMKKRNEYE